MRRYPKAAGHPVDIEEQEATQAFLVCATILIVAALAAVHSAAV